MNSDFRKAISKPVIRLEDIVSLRSHLELRHPDVSPFDRAEMMSDGIHKMLEANLTGLDSEIRTQLTKSLISNQLIQQHQSILKLDILNSILKMDIHPDYLVAKTWNWYVMNTGHPVTLSDFIEQVSPYLPHAVRNAITDSNLAQTNYSRYTAKYSADQPAITEAASTPVVPPVIEPEIHNAVTDNIPLISRPKAPWILVQLMKTHRITHKGKMLLAGILTILMVVAVSPIIFDSFVSTLNKNASINQEMKTPMLYTAEVTSFLQADAPLMKPEYLRYQNVSIENLKSFLEQKKSMLVTEDYLEQLLKYSYEKDLNPLLLIAIIGQEQNYVPLQHPFAKRMIENPFNIYGSWETHPVGFTASMKEACYTINKALSSRTLYTDPFEVINNRYAEDDGWHLGVKVIFRDLMAVAGE